MPKANHSGASNAWEEIIDEGARVLHSVIHPRGTEEAAPEHEPVPDGPTPDQVPAVDHPSGEPETSMGDKFKDVVPEEAPAEEPAPAPRTRKSKDA